MRPPYMGWFLEMPKRVLLQLLTTAKHNRP